ncbi:MAG: hypothetical protein GY841_18950 [FCB group bacterium]|nr:hypothetical protein [FCB group bacterium]
MVAARAYSSGLFYFIIAMIVSVVILSLSLILFHAAECDDDHCPISTVASHLVMYCSNPAIILFLVIILILSPLSCDNRRGMTLLHISPRAPPI